jgi:hypothetical protein
MLNTESDQDFKTQLTKNRVYESQGFSKPDSLVENLNKNSMIRVNRQIKFQKPQE